MQITDFTTQDGRSSLQPLKRHLKRAASQVAGNTDKNIYLVALMTTAIAAVVAGEDGEFYVTNDLPTDNKSNSSVEGLTHKITHALSEAVIYGGDYATELAQIFQDVIANI